MKATIAVLALSLAPLWAASHRHRRLRTRQRRPLPLRLPGGRRWGSP